MWCWLSSTMTSTRHKNTAAPISTMLCDVFTSHQCRWHGIKSPSAEIRQVQFQQFHNLFCYITYFVTFHIVYLFKFTSSDSPITSLYTLSMNWYFYAKKLVAYKEVSKQMVHHIIKGFTRHWSVSDITVINDKLNHAWPLHAGGWVHAKFSPVMCRILSWLLSPLDETINWGLHAYNIYVCAKRP